MFLPKKTVFEDGTEVRPQEACLEFYKGIIDGLDKDFDSMKVGTWKYK